MTIEKKLDALIDALGFDVEVIETITLDGKPLQKPVIGAPGEVIAVDNLRNIVRGIDYKLTKRGLQQGPDNNKLSEPKPSVSIDQLVKNIINLSQLESDLRYIKYKKCDFDRVVSWFGDLAKRHDTDGDGDWYLILGVEVFLDD